MRGDQLARQWRILRTIESSKQGVTVAQFAEEEDCHPRTIWRDLAAIQAAGFPLHSERGEPRLLSITKTPKLDKGGNVEFVVIIAPEVGDNTTIAQVIKSYGTPFEEIDIPLTDFVGERSSITLEVRANGSSLEDRAVWLEAKIIR